MQDSFCTSLIFLLEQSTELIPLIVLSKTIITHMSAQSLFNAKIGVKIWLTQKVYMWEMYVQGWARVTMRILSLLLYKT